MKKTEPKLDVPLTAEAREALIESRFGLSLPHYGETFLPDDIFYTNLSGKQQAKHMVSVLCTWLGIKPGYIGLEFQPDDNHVPEGQRFSIYIDPTVLQDEFLVGAAIAYGLTSYLIELRGGLLLIEPERGTLLATSSILFGLGLIIANGLWPVPTWLDHRYTRFQKPVADRLFGQAFEVNYQQLLRGFLRAHSSDLTYGYCVTPRVAKMIGIKVHPKPSLAIRESMHTVHMINTKILGAMWLVVLVVVIGSFTLLNRAAQQSEKVKLSQEQVNLFAKLERECRDNLEYQRQYADLTDIQTIRSLNAVSLRCQSLNNQYQGALEEFPARQ